LLAALTQGNSGLLSAALEDRIHQPYRAALCPLLPALQQLHAATGILGVALSGAGPSVLIFVDPETGIAGVKTRIETHLREAGLSAEIVAAAITTRGGDSLLPR
jgi:homoserine kinase